MGYVKPCIRCGKTILKCTCAQGHTTEKQINIPAYMIADAAKAGGYREQLRKL